MKYLKYFENNEVLYQEASADDFTELNLIDPREESIKILNDYIKEFTEERFRLDGVYSRHSDRYWNELRIDFQKSDYERSKISFMIDIIEYNDDWFLLKLTLFENHRSRSSDVCFFKCDTIQGVMQALDKYLK